MTDPNTQPVAGFWRRFASVMLDGIIFIPVSLASLVITFMYPGYYAFTSLAIYGIFAAYYTLMLSCKWQATIGMRLMKVYGANLNGGRLSRLHALKWIGISFAFFIIAYLPIFIMVPPWASFEEQMAASMDPLFLPSMLLCYGLLLAWALTIGLSKRRVGLHNRIAKVRFFKGKAENAA